MYVQSDTLLLADVFENIRNMCFEIYELDPAKFVSAPGLASDNLSIDDNIRDENLQYDINREAAKISALSSGEIGKYKFLTDEDEGSTLLIKEE